MLYTIKDTKAYVASVRRLISEHNEDLDDAKAIRIIEDYVFRQDKSGCCSHDENQRIIQRIFFTIRGEMDILQPYIDDPSISEIMVNGPEQIFVERNGVIRKLDVAFDTEEDLEELIRRIAGRVHREINELHPIVDARLSDGSRVNAVLGGIALDGPALTIRKFPEKALTLEDLLQNETLPEDAARLLHRLVRARYNCFVSGGTSSGKTTLLNVLSQSIPPEERVIVIEDSAELQIHQVENIVRLECRNANNQGKGAIEMAQLVRNSLRMRPDRIIVGEVRGAEVMDMIQAMNTGHAGSMSTGHANSIEGMLKRLEAMFLQAAEIPVEAIRSQISEGIDVVIHMSRTREGRRRVMEIAELDSPRGGIIQTNHLYRYPGGLTGRKLIHGEKLRTWS